VLKEKRIVNVEKREAMVTVAGPWGDWARYFLALAALVLIASAIVLPVWRSALSAPQYPEGLNLVVFGDRAEGDLAEIDSLNHYIGMRPFRLEELPELVLWLPGLVAGGIAVLVGLFRRGLVARLARLFLWLLPLSILAVIQFRLYQFGHDLDPGAAFRMDGFTPWVIGPTRVWNFTAWSWPGSGISALLAAAALVTFGPTGLARLRRSRSFPAAPLVILIMMASLPAAAHTDQDHSGHDPSGEGGEMSQPSAGSWMLGEQPNHAVPSEVVIDTDRLIDLEALIAGVADGGTLVLPAGAYRGDVVLARPISIEGQGMPVLVGNGTGTVLTIAAAGTTIKGIHVTGSGPGPAGQPAGIRVAADEVELDGVVVADSYIGIAVDNVERVRILNSLIMGRAFDPIGGEGHAVNGAHEGHHGGGRGDGISIWESEAVLVRGSRVQDVRDGVYASFGRAILVDGNVVTGSRYAVHTMFSRDLVLVENRFEANLSGAVLMYGGPVSVVKNGIFSNRSPSTGFAVLLKDVIDAEVVQNTMVDNRIGIHVDGPAGGSTPIRVTANTVAGNHFGVLVYPSASAVFMANSFVDNLVQVAQQGGGSATGLAWSDRGWGNYWSTYRGFDNGEGKGAVAHREASSINRVLVRSPLLAPLASSPAMRLIQAVEERWLQRSPVAIDHLPLTVPVSPSMPVSTPEPIAVAAAAIAGFTMFLLAGGGFLRLSRRPRLRVGGTT
jgi:nitrous oxidase accessory protein